MAKTHKRRRHIRRTKRKRPRVVKRRRAKTTIRRRKIQRGGNTLDTIKSNVGDVLSRAWGTFDTFRRKKKEPTVPSYAPNVPSYAATVTPSSSTFAPRHLMSSPTRLHLPASPNTDLHQDVRKLQQDTAATAVTVEQNQKQIQRLLQSRQPSTLTPPASSFVPPTTIPTPISGVSVPPAVPVPSSVLAPLAVAQTPRLGESGQERSVAGLTPGFSEHEAPHFPLPSSYGSPATPATATPLPRPAGDVGLPPAHIETPAPPSSPSRMGSLESYRPGLRNFPPSTYD